MDKGKQQWSVVSLHGAENTLTERPPAEPPIVQCSVGFYFTAAVHFLTGFLSGVLSLMANCTENEHFVFFSACFCAFLRYIVRIIWLQSVHNERFDNVATHFESYLKY